MLEPDAVKSDTKLVLTNAIYFKAAWAEAFDKTQTIDEDFFTAREAKVLVPMMHNWWVFRFDRMTGKGWNLGDFKWLEAWPEAN